MFCGKIWCQKHPIILVKIRPTFESPKSLSFKIKVGCKSLLAQRPIRYIFRKFNLFYLLKLKRRHPHWMDGTAHILTLQWNWSAMIFCYRFFNDFGCIQLKHTHIAMYCIYSKSHLHLKPGNNVKTVFKS